MRASKCFVLLVVTWLSLIGVTGPVGAAPLPPMPSDQNQLPELPAEPRMFPRIIPLLPPDRDPWYQAPVDLATLRNGDVVRTRTVQSFALGLPIPVATRQILYRSSDTLGRPVVTATTVLTPGIPWRGSPRPLVSYQEAIDSTAGICNPSYTLRAGLFKETALTQFFLEQGMAVAIPDFIGQRPVWQSRSEGHLVLDGIRAVKRDSALGLADSAVGLYGYSGGGSGSAWAAELHKTYAPELNIRGSAQGGVPGDKAIIMAYASQQRFGIANWSLWPVLVSMAREYPTVIRLDELLTPQGQAIARDMDQRCIYSESVSGIFRPLSAYLRDPTAFDRPAIRKVLEELSPGEDPGQVPDMPVLQWHAVGDEFLPLESVRPMVRTYCAAGVDLRFFAVPLSEHLIADLVGWPPASAWLSGLLRGGGPGARVCPSA